MDERRANIAIVFRNGVQIPNQTAGARFPCRPAVVIVGVSAFGAVRSEHEKECTLLPDPGSTALSGHEQK
jgi:hypothetical protein